MVKFQCVNPELTWVESSAEFVLHCGTSLTCYEEGLQNSIGSIASIELLHIIEVRARAPTDSRH